VTLPPLEALQAAGAKVALDGGVRTVDFDDADVVTGVDCARLVDALRGLLALGPVALHDVPQSLAHVLYRTGLLPAFQRCDVRADEPAAP
jgi:hypothetical protein